jgi:hypothetical protein
MDASVAMAASAKARAKASFLVALLAEHFNVRYPHTDRVVREVVGL